MVCYMGTEELVCIVVVQYLLYMRYCSIKQDRTVQIPVNTTTITTLSHQSVVT